MEADVQDETAKDWPGKAEGIPRPPTSAELDEISEQQGMIADEWAPQPVAPTPRDETVPAPETAKNEP